MHLMTNDPETQKKFIIRFIRALEDIFAKLYRQKEKYKREVPQVVLNFELEKKTDFYGYHSKPEYFIKLYLFDPKFVKPLGKIL